MTTPADEARLSRIETAWTLVKKACAGERREQEEMLSRYRAAVYRYLCGLLRDEDAAEVAFQDLCVRFLRGDFRGLCPERGGFRVYLKMVLRNLANDHWRGMSRRADELAVDPPDDADDLEKRADAEWLAEVDANMMRALEREDPRLFAVLSLSREFPEDDQSALAAKLRETTGEEATAGKFRRMLHSAREKSADLLLAEVMRTLGSPTRDELLAELAELGWLGRLTAALRRRGLVE